MKRHHPRLIAVGLCVATLAACSGADSSPASVDEAPAETSATPSTPVEAETSAATPDTPKQPEASSATSFAAAPAKGWVIRSNCRMGSCSWDRFEQVMRSGTDAAPVYDLRLARGESQHPQDPYPNRPDGVQISWQAQPIPAQVKCSRTAPYAMAENQSDTLKLNPQGVAGAVQGLANLYFATCHGEYGDDAQLARKWGYELR